MFGAFEEEVSYAVQGLRWIMDFRGRRDGVIPNALVLGYGAHIALRAGAGSRGLGTPSHRQPYARDTHGKDCRTGEGGGYR